MNAADREPGAAGKWLGANKKHAKRCRERWLARRDRRPESPEYRRDWDVQQCGACRYWVPVVGLLTETFGACTNAASPFDRLVRFVHDGCDQFSPVVKNPER